MCSAARRARPKAWREAAHTIKGSASAVGAWRLARFAEMAERVDVEAQQRFPRDIRDEAVAAVATAGEEACRYIARLLARHLSSSDAAAGGALEFARPAR